MTEERAATRKEKQVSLFEATMTTVGMTKLGSISLGFVITLLVLLSGFMIEATAVKLLSVLVVLLVLAFVFAIVFQEEAHPGFGSWGVIALFLLGSALGVLAYHARAGIAEQWLRYKSLGGLNDAVLAGLLVFGVLMGVFVVRIWNKEQDDFIKSVTASFGGAIIPPLLGKTINVDAGQAFAAYFLGFAVSAVVNVIYCAKLIGDYTNQLSRVSRARLDFMYGKDKAKAVDHYFLENFRENQDTVKLLLTQTLRTYSLEVKKGFAAKLTSRRRLEASSSPPSGSRRRYYYELISIVRGPNASATSPPSSSDEYEVEFRRIGEAQDIGPEMFRVGITVKWADNLEYVVAPGAYKKTLPYNDSVAGLALKERRVIVMDRDQNKEFRSGGTPGKKEQPRELKETTYLSYISIPIVSDLGYPQETELGIVNVDTKLFATEHELELPKASQVNENENRWRMKTTIKDLRGLGSNLYDEPDGNVDYLNEMKSVIEPVLRLYLICRQGSV